MRRSRCVRARDLVAASSAAAGAIAPRLKRLPRRRAALETEAAAAAAVAATTTMTTTMRSLHPATLRFCRRRRWWLARAALRRPLERPRPSRLVTAAPLPAEQRRRLLIDCCHGRRRQRGRCGDSNRLQSKKKTLTLLLCRVYMYVILNPGSSRIRVLGTKVEQSQ